MAGPVSNGSLSDPPLCFECQKHPATHGGFCEWCAQLRAVELERRNSIDFGAQVEKEYAAVLSDRRDRLREILGAFDRGLALKLFPLSQDPIVAAATAIQRVWRGHVARKLYVSMLAERLAAEESRIEQENETFFKTNTTRLLGCRWSIAKLANACHVVRAETRKQDDEFSLSSAETDGDGASDVLSADQTATALPLAVAAVVVVLLALCRATVTVMGCGATAAVVCREFAALRLGHDRVPELRAGAG